ncbi:hypothetical protein [Nesterenkonia alkaliphila]|uniref:Uncharacterized protein n=1 Tax=Nesterenkonia alkaliphila TaxID=1463631 RepID=A0A7K1UFX4_9MICC|nr:hypothetical protein [Nesterenkonia alkaliphila]MVT24991.1 hypothetical protein [Nesterenkonia alkaliphila]GFZ87096.1 hypothetical protein GCM10011359_15450 [Nesterenkonia alkaliphila]
MGTTKQITVEVPEEHAEVLDRAVESGTVEDLAEAANLGFENVVAEQLDFEARMEEKIIPRLQEMRENPSIALTSEQMRAKMREELHARRAEAAWP